VTLLTDPELIIGLVTPIGANTSELADNLCGALSDYHYTTIVIKLSDHLPGPPGPLGEKEDARVRRLIEAGDAFCARHTSESHPDGDPAALARLAIREIRKARLQLLRQDGDTSPVEELTYGRERTAYILHSLKRPAEVTLLREVYGEQFILIGSQASIQQREDHLMHRPMPALDEGAKRDLVRNLVRQDADEGNPVGQLVNDTYPLADFFLRDNQVERTIDVLFGQPIAPEIGEFAMYLARASAARSLAASRKVGAAIVVNGSVISTGYNDAPHGQRPDVIEGRDSSELMKQENVLDTIRRLKQGGLLSSTVDSLDEQEIAQKAIAALRGGELLGVIEYQRAVHAEALAIDDATVRGISPVGGTLYVTTYPCHLCFKHALSVRLERVEYIEPYPKSRAGTMYPSGTDQRLVPYAGVAPRRYLQVFETRKAFVADTEGNFPEVNRRVARPLLEAVRNDDDRSDEERFAVNGLQEEFQ
jgi:deoxycytidylate deaminase